MQALKLSNPLLQSTLQALEESFPKASFKFKAQVLANLHLESGGFILDKNGNTLEENLHYKPEKLLELFPKHVKDLPDALKLCTGGSSCIANRIYSHRLGNGDEASGDGYLYIGRGLIQITGRDNYAAITLALDHDFLTNPKDLSLPEWAAKSSMWFIGTKQPQFGKYAEAQLISACRQLINGGLHGFADLLVLYPDYRDQLKGG